MLMQELQYEEEGEKTERERETRQCRPSSPTQFFLFMRACTDVCIYLCNVHGEVFLFFFVSVLFSHSLAALSLEKCGVVAAAAAAAIVS